MTLGYSQFLPTPQTKEKVFQFFLHHPISFCLICSFLHDDVDFNDCEIGCFYAVCSAPPQRVDRELDIV